MATYGEVVQVSDRQVTSVVNGTPRAIYSALENKSVIFLGTDCVGVLGYTGSAYIDGAPTDEWLANLVANRTLPAAAYLGASIPRHHLRLNKILWRIQSALNTLQLGQSEIVAVDVAGYRCRRRYIVPFIVRLRWPPHLGAPIFQMRMP
jgi:hypothetical protein